MITHLLGKAISYVTSRYDLKERSINEYTPLILFSFRFSLKSGQRLRRESVKDR